jgi:hypothetical protein
MATPTFPFTGDTLAEVEALYIGYFERVGDPGGDRAGVTAREKTL